MVIRRSAEVAFVAMALLMMSGALDQLVATSTTVEARISGDANFMLRALSFPAYIYSIGIFVLRFGQSMNEMRRVMWLTALVLMAAVSATWSIDPAATVPRVLLLLLATAFGWAISVRFDWASFIRILGIACVAMVAVQLASVLVVPSLAVHHDIHYPAVRGMFLHKNIAGRTIALGVIPGLALFGARSTRKLGVLVVSSCVIGVLATLSASSYLLVAAIVATHVFLRFYARQRLLGGGVAVMAMLALSTIVVSGVFGDVAVSLLEGMGRDATLSTRTLIWDRLYEEVIPDRPYLGYGYNAFWSSAQGALSVWNPRYFVPSHAHNGVLQTWVSIGVAGVAILVFGYFSTVIRAAREFHASSGRVGNFPLVFLVFYAITNFSEVSVLSYSGIIWVVFVIVCSHIYARRLLWN